MAPETVTKTGPKLAAVFTVGHELECGPSGETHREPTQNNHSGGAQTARPVSGAKLN